MSVKPHLVVIGNTHSNPSAAAFLVKFGSIMKEVAENAYFITADSPPISENVRWIRAEAKESSLALLRYLLFFQCQLRICMILVRMRRDYDQSIVLATPFLIPVLTLRMLGKRVFAYVDGRPSRIAIRILCRLDFALADILVAETRGVVDLWRIRSHQKVRYCPMYVDTSLFNFATGVRNRQCVVGFLGRLDADKGIREMLEAIRLITQTRPDIKYIIGGSGRLDEYVRRFSARHPNIDFKRLLAWGEMPSVLSQCRLIVVPSYSEGLPNIVLEAMACGTPVLATPVGGIPDVVRDGETGFIVADASPASIAKNVLRALENPELERIAENALKMIRAEFTRSDAVKRYWDLICLPEAEER